MEFVRSQYSYWQWLAAGSWQLTGAGGPDKKNPTEGGGTKNYSCPLSPLRAASTRGYWNREKQE